MYTIFRLILPPSYGRKRDKEEREQHTRDTIRQKKKGRLNIEGHKLKKAGDIICMICYMTK
jgi:hypothetical protein